MERTIWNLRNWHLNLFHFFVGSREGVRGKGTLRIEITENFMVKMSFTQLFHSLVVAIFVSVCACACACLCVCTSMRSFCFIDGFVAFSLSFSNSPSPSLLVVRIFCFGCAMLERTQANTHTPKQFENNKCLVFFFLNFDNKLKLQVWVGSCLCECMCFFFRCQIWTDSELKKVSNYPGYGRMDPWMWLFAMANFVHNFFSS